jgi:phosphatidate cytidylyltransferase
MLRTRLWMGTVLVILAAGMLLIDQRLAPWYPFLFVMLVGLSLAACYELVHLVEPSKRPQAWLCYLAVAVMIAANWPSHLLGPIRLHFAEPEGWEGWRIIFPYYRPWLWLAGTLSGVILVVFLVEMANFREPGGVLGRMALVLFVAGYLGLLPSFLAQLRWLDMDKPLVGTMALALAIFVPKVCDIGAYSTGRLLGRHKMAPVLSPKKTWEGAAGGLAAAIAISIVLDRLTVVSPLHGDLALEIGFGLSMGIASMLGDLAESMIKRDCGHKDASQAVPGFGGILDVVDSVIFPAPLAYVWFRTTVG